MWSGVSQNINMNASPTAKNFSLSNFYLHGPFNFILSNSPLFHPPADADIMNSSLCSMEEVVLYLALHASSASTNSINYLPCRFSETSITFLPPLVVAKAVSVWNPQIWINEWMKIYIWRIKTSTQNLACSKPHRERERQTDRQTDTDTETQRETETELDRQTVTETQTDRQRQKQGPRETSVRGPAK